MLLWVIPIGEKCMTTEYKCVTTTEGIKEYIAGSPLVAFDFETAPDDAFREEDKSALDPAKAHIVGCSFSIRKERESMCQLLTVAAPI